MPFDLTDKIAFIRQRRRLEELEEEHEEQLVLAVETQPEADNSLDYQQTEHQIVYQYNEVNADGTVSPKTDVVTETAIEVSEPEYETDWTTLDTAKPDGQERRIVDETMLADALKPLVDKVEEIYAGLVSLGVIKKAKTAKTDKNATTAKTVKTPKKTKKPTASQEK